MKFSPLQIPGAFLVDIAPIEDERGFFARTWCEQEFAAAGLCTQVVQCNVSFNVAKHTLRGMHWQAAPHGEVKLVRCTRGAIYDVLLDLRPGSPYYGKWLGEELTAQNHRMLYIPDGIAHGFLTLEDNSEVAYQMSEFFHAESARGVRWNDPAFEIQWPAVPVQISSKDSAYADFVLEGHSVSGC